MTSRLLRLATTVAVLLAASNAAAAPRADVARADALFRDAQQLLQKGQTAEACAAFAESQRLDPANGTLLNLALCHEKEGKTATAQRELKELLGALGKNADDQKRARVANEHLRDLEKKLSRLLFDTTLLPADATVTLDGEKVGDAATAVDQGTHAVVASAPRKKTATSSVEVKEPGVRTIKLDALADEVVVPPVAEVPATPEPARPAAKAGYWSGQRTAGAATFGVGLVGLGLGTVFGLDTFSKRDARDLRCDGTVCDAEGLRLHDEARSSATIASIGFGAGIAAIAMGTVLFLTAPRARPKPDHGASGTVDVAFGPDGLAVRGVY